MPAAPKGGSAGGGGGGGSASGIRAGAAYVELYLKDNKLVRGLENIRKRIGSMGSWLAGVGGKLAPGAGLLAAPFTLMFRGAVEQAGALDDLADAYGTTTEALSPLAGHAFQVAGLGMEDLDLAMKEVAKRDNSGRPIEQVLAEWVDGLNEIQDPAERARKAIEMFGKSGIRMAKIAPDLKRLMKNAPVTDSETAKAAEQLDQGLERIKLAIKAAMMPAIQPLALVADKLAEFFENNKEGVGIVAGVTVAVVGLGAALTGLGLAFSLVAGGAGVVAAAVGAVLSPIGLAVAGVGALGYALATQTEVGRETTSSLKAGFTEAAETAQTAWGGIVNAIKKGDLELALQVAVAGMSLEWAKFELFLTRGWVAFKATFVDGWHELALNVKRVWNALTTGLAIGLTYAMDAVVWIFNQTIGRLIRGAADLLEAVDATETANDLRALGHIDGLGDQVRADIMRQGEQDDKQLRDEFEKAKADRNAFRVAQIGKAMGKVEEARRAFEEVVGRAMVPKKDEDKSKSGLPKLATAVSGAFQSPDWKGRFGIGDRVSEKALKKQQEQLDAMNNIARILKAMDILRVK